jgi:hypothetical protein
MLSFELPQALRPIAATAALMLVTSVAIAATEPDAEQLLLDQIQETLSREGPYAPELLEALTRLGLLYQESEDYTFALVTIERALQIVRVNRGLHSLDQVPLVRQLIRIEEARGNHAGAWEREQSLLTLVRRHPDDVRTVPVLEEIADKQMDALDAVIAGKRPPRVVLGCFYEQFPNGREGNCNSGSRKTVVQGMLAEAHRNYSDAIGILLRNGLYDSDKLRSLEMAILRGVYSVRSRYGGPFALVPAVLGAASIEPWRSRIAPIAALVTWDLPYPSEGRRPDSKGHVAIRQMGIMDPYWRGRESLLRLSAYAAASGDSPLGQAAAVVQIADWDLLHSHNGQALDTYEAAYAMLVQAAVARAVIDELFAPSTPVVLPAFRPNPLATAETKAATGHVDVAFEITKYGRGRDVVILSAANATQAETDGLVTLIKSNRFRPPMKDGRLADAVPVVVRYQLYD